jgi:hypothetical protein
VVEVFEVVENGATIGRITPEGAPSRAVDAY